MPEPFASFGQSYRALFASMLAISSSGIAGFLLMAAKQQKPDYYFIWSYNIGFISLIITVLILVAATYIGLLYEAKEGETSEEKLTQRNINKNKLKIISIALLLFAVGIICLLIAGLTIFNS